MSARVGQAFRASARATLMGCGATLRGCGLVLRLLMALLLLGGVGLGALAWRLDQGPIWLPAFARALERNAEGALGGMGLRIDRAGLAWAGWREGYLSPLEVRVIGARLLDDAGHVRAELPDGAVSLSLPRLLRGQVAPRQLEMAAPKLTLVRQMDGSVSLDFGLAVPEALPDAPPGPAEPTAPDMLIDILSGETAGEGPLGALERLRLVDGELTLIDRRQGAVWRLSEVQAVLARRETPLGRRLPGILGQGRAKLLTGTRQVALGFEMESETDGAGRASGLRVSAEVQPFSPAALAEAMPALAALKGAEAPVGLTLKGHLGLDGALREAEAVLSIGAGNIPLGQGALRLQSGRIAASLTPERLVLRGSEIRLAPAAAQAGGAAFAQTGAVPPVLRLSGGAQKAQERWAATLDLSLDALNMAELPAFWPPGLVRNTREWLVENATAGLAQDGRWRIGAEAAADLSEVKLTALSGSIAVREGVVHWLRPIPPLVGVSGTVEFTPTEVLIRAQGQQQGTAVQAREATIRFFALDTNDEQAQIEGRLQGPAGDVLSVLKHPRLKLFDKRPLEISNPTGTVEATLNLAFPLLANLPTERIAVSAEAKLANIRIPDAVLGQPIERGQFSLSVDTRGLKASGNATVGGVPGRLGLEMDFRDGPITQVITRESADLRGDAQALARFGFDLGKIAAGPLGLEVRTERRRNGRGEVSVKADLRETALAVGALAWSKARGVPANAEAVFRLQGNRLLSADGVRLSAPRLSASGQAFFGEGNRFERAEIADGRLDEGRFSGTAMRPLREGAPWRFALRGPVGDLTAIMADETPPDPQPGNSLPVFLEARFERVLLGPGRVLYGVQATGQSDANGAIREAKVTGRADGPESGFDLAVIPRPAGRELRLQAQDGGALLRAFDVLTTIHGGRLSVTGRWPSNAPGTPLEGNAEMQDFVIRDAPAIGKFLQAITVYGLVDAARGPGLSFNRAVVPFALTPEALQLNDARAFSSSLGVTAKGRIMRHGGPIELEGTVVPAYAINTLLGNLPVLGRLFSPERGGGLIAVNWRMNGPAEDPSVTVNPLSVLTPGFLRGLFGIFDGTNPAAGPPPVSPGRE